MVDRVFTNNNSLLEYLMPQTQINCPQCRQPIVADVNQLFDVAENPQVKQIFLSGAFNLAQCPHCGYQGMLTMPLVYHDPEKEMLLTYFPPEMGLPLEEQQKSIGPLINRVVNNLPQEKRKGYLLNPKTMLTLQVMLETILEADGITKEMIQAQQDRINLIQRLMEAKGESRVEIIQQEDEMIDGDFFGILSRIMESAMMGQDDSSAKELNKLQKTLLEYSTRGKELKVETEEVQAVMQSLRDMGDNVSREKLFDLIIEAPSDTRLRAIARLARPGLDYTFFQMLSEKIDRARKNGRERLVEIREKLLTYSAEVDAEIANRTEVAQKNVEAVLQAEDLKATIEGNIDAIDEFFIQAVTDALDAARKVGDLGHSARLQQILDTINELSAPPPEFKFVEELLAISDDENALNAAVEARGDEITSDVIQMINSLITQTMASLDQAEGDEKRQRQEVAERLQAVNGAVLGYSMRRSFKSN
jgi:hypothetical protein